VDKKRAPEFPRELPDHAVPRWKKKLAVRIDIIIPINPFPSAAILSSGNLSRYANHYKTRAKRPIRRVPAEATTGSFAAAPVDFGRPGLV